MLIPLSLMVLGILLVLLEVLIPSGGILGFLAAAALTGSLVLAFQEDPTMGYIMLGATGVSLPIVIVLGFKYLPKTPFGRRLILTPKDESDAVLGKAGVSEKDFSVLQGQEGQAVSPLRPSGFAEFGEERFMVTTTGDLIDEGEMVVVVNVEGNSIVVERKETGDGGGK